jgi:hypothetical protein
MDYETTRSSPLLSPGDIGEREWQVFRLTLELLSDRDKRKALRLLQENLGLSAELEPERDGPNELREAVSRF